jgi:hypothetical protein
MTHCDFEGEYIDIFAEGWIYAARPRKCYECGKVTQIEEEYKRIVAVIQDETENYCHCCLCARVMDDLLDMGFCPCYGELWEYIGEEFDQPDEEEGAE